jgi:hypothetical protein
MNLKELVNKGVDKILARLELSEAPEKLEVTATLEDGGEIFTTEPEWAVGVPVFVRNEEGEPVSVPDGSYKISTGEVLVVAEGMLAEITTEESEVEEALSKIVEAFQKKLNEVSESFTAEINSLKEENKALAEKFSALPAAGSVKTEKRESNYVEPKDKVQRARMLLNR